MTVYLERQTRKLLTVSVSKIWNKFTPNFVFDQIVAVKKLLPGKKFLLV